MIASCPRPAALSPFHPAAGAASSGPGRWEHSGSSPCDQLICTELIRVHGLIWKQLKFCAKQAEGWAACRLARMGPFHHQRRNLISVGLGWPRISKQGGQLNPGAGHTPQSRRQAQPWSALDWRHRPTAQEEKAAPTGITLALWFSHSPRPTAPCHSHLHKWQAHLRPTEEGTRRG